MILFVYGTLKKGFSLHSYLKDSIFLGKGYINGYDMFLISWYPGIVKGKGKVFGEVYKINERTLKEIDKIEDGYERVKEKVYLENGKSLEAFVYIYRGKTDNLPSIKSGIFKQF